MFAAGKIHVQAVHKFSHNQCGLLAFAFPIRFEKFLGATKKGEKTTEMIAKSPSHFGMFILESKTDSTEAELFAQNRSIIRLR